jgi:hypothetical protein
MVTTNALASLITVSGPVDVSECTGATEYLASMEVENNVPGSREPFLAFSLLPTDYTINNLTFTCPVSTLTRIGNFVPQNPETDNATVSLEFYNLPLGELYDSIESDVDGVKKSIDGVWDTIGDLQKFLGYAEKLCKILNTVMTTISTLTTVMALLTTIGIGLRWIPFGIGESIHQTMKENARALCNPTESFRKVYDFELLKLLKQFCDYITCQKGTLELVGVDWQGGNDQWIYNWLGGGQVGGDQLQGSVAQEGEIVQNPGTYLNVKDSLIYSIVIPPLCIPGIIYNLDKWRQIECRYGLCLLDDVRQQGMPIPVCKDQKHYMQCRFVVGEIFNIIPFAALVNQWLTSYQQILSDPLTLVTTIVGKILNCEHSCADPETPGWQYSICAGMTIASQLGYTINQIRNIQTLSDFGSISSQWCEEFEDALDEFEEESAAGEGTGMLEAGV